LWFDDDVPLDEFDPDELEDHLSLFATTTSVLMEHDFALSVAFFELAVCIFTHGGDRFITICPQIEFTFVFPSQRQRRFIVMEKCYPDATMPFPTAYGSGPCQNVAHSGILHHPAPVHYRTSKIRQHQSRAVFIRHT
jgi:hypothetical protein